MPHALKSLTLLSTLAAVCPSISPAAILVEELFNYSNQTVLGGRNGGVGFKEAWWTGVKTGGTGKWTLGPGSVTISGVNSAWAGRAITPITGAQYASIYFTFDISVSDYAGNASGSFADLVDFRGDGAQVFGLGLGFDTNGYGVQLRTYGTGGATTNIGTRYTTAGETFTLTGKLTFGTATQASLSVWISPESATEQPAFTTSLFLDTTQLTRLTLQRYDDYLRAGSIQTTYGPIRVGTDWYSIHPSHEPAPIPEPGSAVVLAGVFSGGAAMLRRRRRR